MIRMQRCRRRRRKPRIPRILMRFPLEPDNGSFVPPHPMRGIAERIQGMIDTGNLPFPMFPLSVALLLIELLLLDDRSITPCFSLFLSFHPFAFSKTFQSIAFGFGESSRTLVDGPTRRRHADHHDATTFLRPQSPRLASVVNICGIGTCVTFDTVSRREKSVESLDERRMGMEQGRDAVDYARGIDSLAFEFLHDVEETVVNVGLVGKLDLGQRGVSNGFDVTRSVSPELAGNRGDACSSRHTTDLNLHDNFPRPLSSSHRSPSS